MKKIITASIAGVLLGGAATFGAVSSNGTEVTISMTSAMTPTGEIRYDIHNGGTFYSFYGKEELEKFTETHDNDPETELVRKALEPDMTAKGVDTVISELESHEQTYTVNQ